MRFFLFLGGLLGLIGWLIYKWMNPEASALNSIAGTGVDKVSETAGKITATPVKPPPPIITKSYTFQHIPLPDDRYFTQFVGGSSGADRQNIKIITNPATRSVSFIGHLDEVLAAHSTLKFADAPPSGCDAKAWIVFVRKDKNDAFNLGFEYTQNPLSSSFSLSGKTFNGLLAIKNVEATLDVLHSRGVVEVVQAPYLSISSGQKSTIVTGEEIAVPIVTINQSVTQTSVEYRKVGLTLELTPQFTSHEKMRLHFKQTNGIVGQLRDVGGVEVPELTNQVLETTIETRVGQVLVLGGVESSQYTKTKGILSWRREKQTGYLYVVLATYSKVPVAQPVLDSVPAGSSLLPPVGALGK